MRRRVYVPQEKGFIIREDALDELEAHADWLRRGCDQTEQLRVSSDIVQIVKKVKAHPIQP
jgi:hypothetical protein